MHLVASHRVCPTEFQAKFVQKYFGRSRLPNLFVNLLICEFEIQNRQKYSNSESRRDVFRRRITTFPNVCQSLYKASLCFNYRSKSRDEGEGIFSTPSR